MVYEIDGEMLICKNQDLVTGRICGGLIDYDEGYNSLVCTTCGAVYQASEIAKILKDKEIIVKANKERGNVKMRVGIRRGNSKVITMDTTNREMGIIRPSTASIVPTANVEKPVEPAATKTVTVSVKQAVNNAENAKKANSPAVKGKVTIKRVPKQNKNYNKSNNNGGYTKSKGFNSGAINNPNFKVKVTRGDQPQNNKKKEHVPGSKGAVAITAVSFDEIKNTTFNFSSYDAENGLVFVKGTTPTGSELTVHFECKDAEGFAKELGIDTTPVVPETTEEETTPDVDANVAMELEQAKADILSLEEKNIALKKEADAYKAQYESAKKLVDTIQSEDSVEDLKKEIETLKTEIDHKNSEMQQLTEQSQKEIATKDENIAEVSDLLNKAHEEIAELTSKLEDSSASEADLNAKDEEILDLQAKLEQSERTVESLKLNLDSRDESINELNTKLEELKNATPPMVELEEKTNLVIMGSQFYPATDFLTEEEQVNYDGPKDVIAITVSFTEQNENGEEVNVTEFAKDDQDRVLAIGYINGISTDELIINQKS